MPWHDGVKTAIGWPVMAGIFIIAVGFGGFGTWAALAPLEGAVIASGRVVVQGQNKVVQHLEGGIIKELLVQDGQVVTSGDPLIVLDGTASESKLNRLKIQVTALEATEARALAERDGADRIAFAQALEASAGAPEIAKVLEDQRKEFQLRLGKYRTELSILQQKIEALKEAIKGHDVERQETENQVELIAEERESFEQLLAKGLARKSHVLQLKRTEADLKGRRGQLTATIAENTQLIAEVEHQIERTRQIRMEDASAELRDLRLKRSDVLEQIRAAEDVSGRVLVRSPASGTVINLSKYNPGAVVSPGQALMEIVPAGTRLTVEARVRPQDVDQVRTGQQARLHFLAFDQNYTPPASGAVENVSADRLEDDRTGEVFYRVHLSISDQPGAGIELRKVGPGQPVEVFITTSERTFLAYVAEPLLKTIRRAMRES